ncbi:hypothetical protein AAFF_G00131780 [Aldrovandia affinis]|uniref:Uncharacterized protein n=1 Tax=Aldrovandia affinis TaxID=143900 RepID=A0AAD7RQM1_9TELE|nr:hypothetical protein AAFF_G00131780 [Aldrovandia affinis]
MRNGRRFEDVSATGTGARLHLGAVLQRDGPWSCCRCGGLFPWCITRKHCDVCSISRIRTECDVGCRGMSTMCSGLLQLHIKCVTPMQRQLAFLAHCAIGQTE